MFRRKEYCFSGNIASNIMFGNQDGSEAEMKKKRQRLHRQQNLSRQNRKKYKSPIAQGGSNVSGGQKQRLSIARAIAKHPQVFIFDDSFSALDYKTDVTLRRRWMKRQGSTVLIVAQRISTILHAEQIIVLDDGKLQERNSYGTSEKL